MKHLKSFALIVSFAVAGCVANAPGSEPSAEAGAPSAPLAEAGAPSAKPEPEAVGGHADAGAPAVLDAGAGGEAAGGAGGAPAKAPGNACPNYFPIEAIRTIDPQSHTLTATFEVGSADVTAVDLTPLAGVPVTLTADGVQLAETFRAGGIWYPLAGHVTAHEIVVEITPYSPEPIMPAGGLRVYCK